MVCRVHNVAAHSRWKVLYNNSALHNMIHNIKKDMQKYKWEQTEVLENIKVSKVGQAPRYTV